jgi:hypothetical protein
MLQHQAGLSQLSSAAGRRQARHRREHGEAVRGQAALTTKARTSIQLRQPPIEYEARRERTPEPAMRTNPAALAVGHLAIVELEIWRTPPRALPLAVAANSLAELNILFRLDAATQGGSSAPSAMM